MPNGQRHLATGLACGSTSPLEDLRRNYRVISDAERAGAQEPSPAEIVARLRKRIAAKSPKHAALVAEFEELQAQRRKGSRNG